MYFEFKNESYPYFQFDDLVKNIYWCAHSLIIVDQVVASVAPSIKYFWRVMFKHNHTSIYSQPLSLVKRKQFSFLSTLWNSSGTHYITALVNSRATVCAELHGFTFMDSHAQTVNSKGSRPVLSIYCHTPCHM